MSAGCQREGEILVAAGRGPWSEETRQHLLECEECAAAAAVASWMSDAARNDVRQHKLPDPAVVWLKAQLLRQQSVAQRAGLPLNIVQIAAYLTVAGGWAALLTWKWRVLQLWVLSLSPRHVILDVSAGDAGSLSLSLPLLFTVVVLASLTVMVALHTIVAEE
jgi:hypothetical protein